MQEPKGVGQMTFHTVENATPPAPIVRELARWQKAGLCEVYWTGEAWDIVAPGQSKATGQRELLKRLGIRLPDLTVGRNRHRGGTVLWLVK